MIPMMEKVRKVQLESNFPHCKAASEELANEIHSSAPTPTNNSELSCRVGGTVGEHSWSRVSKGVLQTSSDSPQTPSPDEAERQVLVHSGCTGMLYFCYFILFCGRESSVPIRHFSYTYFTPQALFLFKSLFLPMTC